MADELEVLDVAGDAGTEVADEPIEISDGADGTESDQPDTGGDGTPGERTEEDAGDGRQVTAQIRAHLAEIKKTNPALAKELQRIYWKGQNVDKLGTTQELTTLKEAVELHGGVDGIGKLAEEVEAGRALEQGFERGDPKVVDGWANDYPEGFKRLIPAALDRLEKMDETRFDQVSSNVSDRIFEKYGVYSAVQQLGEALTANKPEDAVKHFNALTKFLSDMKGLSKRTKENPYQQRESELDQREKDITERDKKAFYGSVRVDVNAQVARSMNQEIGKLLRGKKMSTELGNRVRSEITEELKQLINTGDYSKRYETVMGARDRDKSVKFIVDNAARNMSKAVQTVLKYRNLLGTTAARPAARPGVKPGAAAAQAVVGRPKIGDVDFSKTDKATFLGSRTHGTAWLKNGRQAKW